MSAQTCPRNAFIRTLGCRVNAYESGEIGRRLRELGCGVVANAEAADLIVVNTCAVTAEAGRQARQEIRRLIRINPEARIVVTGCYADADNAGVRDIAGVHAVVGNRDKLDVAGWLGSLPVVARAPGSMRRPVPPACEYPLRTRAVLQIQQGCDHNCTFCIVHTLRGKSRSRPPAEVVSQARLLVEQGCPELVLAGVDLGSYGADLDAPAGYRLPQLLDDLCALSGDFRIRLSSLDPVHLDAELIERFARHERLCPHLHLSLQSGNEIILKRMKRRCSAALARRRVADLRRVRPGLVLSADLMVGFPTETEAQFEDTEAMMREMEIAFAHVFAYSPRPGTPAARIPANRQVGAEEKRRRAARLRRLADESLRRVLEQRVGWRGRVLVERDPVTPEGFHRARAPDNLTVWVPRSESECGRFVEVLYSGVRDRALIGRAIS